jgi:hypothetical protein
LTYISHSLSTKPTDAGRDTSTSPPAATTAIMSTDTIIKKPSFGTTSEQFHKSIQQNRQNLQRRRRKRRAITKQMHREIPTPSWPGTRDPKASTPSRHLLCVQPIVPAMRKILDFILIVFRSLSLSRLLATMVGD